MQKRSNKYYLTLSLKEYANGETEPAKELGIEFDNHDEIFGIIERIKDIFLKIRKKQLNLLLD